MKFFIIMLYALIMITSCTPSVENENYSIQGYNNSRAVKSISQLQDFLLIDANYRAEIFKNEKFLTDSNYRKLSIFVKDSAKTSIYADTLYHFLCSKNYYRNTLLFTKDTLNFYISSNNEELLTVQLADSIYTFKKPLEQDSVALLVDSLTISNTELQDHLEIISLNLDENNLVDSLEVSNEYFKSLHDWLKDISHNYWN